MKLFEDKSRPILDQIIELAEHLEHKPETIDKLKEEFKKGNLDYVMGFAQTLAMQFIGQSILKVIEEEDEQSN